MPYHDHVENLSLARERVKERIDVLSAKLDNGDYSSAGEREKIADSLYGAYTQLGEICAAIRKNAESWSSITDDRICKCPDEDIDAEGNCLNCDQ